MVRDRIRLHLSQMYRYLRFALSYGRRPLAIAALSYSGHESWKRVARGKCSTGKVRTECSRRWKNDTAVAHFLRGQILGWMLRAGRGNEDPGNSPAGIPRGCEQVLRDRDFRGYVNKMRK